MQEIRPTEKQTKLLFRYAEAAYGLKIPHVFIAAKPEATEFSYEQHRQAAILTMEAVERECAKELVCDASQLSGQRISVEQFLGCWYDVGQRHLRWELNPSISQGRGCVLDGYAMGFVRTASGPRKREDVNALFEDLLIDLFGGLEVLTDIYSWNTSWCSYFDEAREWWGAFLWTVGTKDEQIIGIASGTLD